MTSWRLQTLGEKLVDQRSFAGGRSPRLPETKKRLPALRPEKNACDSPHVVILGAGASRAAFLNGDRNGKRLPLMADLVEFVGLEEVLSEAGIKHKGRNFERIFTEFMHATDLRHEIELLVYDYFADLGLPEHVTLYDELVLSLRKKDLIATFNWDPLLLHAYARNSAIEQLPAVLFLHGNVGVGACREHRRKGHQGTNCEVCGNVLEPTPLLYPITEKDYFEDPFIRSEWQELRHFLEYAYLVTIFGYSAPDADAAAMELMHGAWTANLSREFAQISIVDLKGEEELERTWSPFFVRNHYGTSEDLDGSNLFTHPRRSCDAFAMATLQLHPCQPNPLPRLRDLPELHKWIRPLVDQEVTDAPFDC